MSQLLSLGAIKKQTGEYVYPKIANKKDEYICPECNKDLILVQGEIRVHHFRHKFDNVNPCHHYSNPNETQIHKDAKMLMKTLLEKNVNISFIRNCKTCKKNDEFEIPPITDTSSIQLEHRFDYNGTKIADVAYIDDGEIVCIFEIYHSHKTDKENRPEPWFEIDALFLINVVNDMKEDSKLKINCIRCEKCDECIQKEKDNIEKKNKATDILYNWFNTGIEIKPFRYDEGDKFGVCKKNDTCEINNDVYDLIVYVDNVDKNIYQKYCINLIYNYDDYSFTKEKKYAYNDIAVYYLDIDWILSQQNIPEFIKIIASLDCYNYNHKSKYCIKCKTNYRFWVRLIKTPEYYKAVSIGCDSCGYESNSEYIHCERCNSFEELIIMATNVHTNMCKQCDIECFKNIYLSVSFREKEQVKQLGAKWDIKYKKWFIMGDNINKDYLLQKFREGEYS